MTGSRDRGSGGRAGPALPRSLSRRMASFCRALRRAGLKIGLGDAALSLDALLAVDATDRRDAYLALRTVLVRRREEQTVFDELFRAFFGAEGVPLHLAHAVQEEEEAPGAGGEAQDEGDPNLSDWGQSEPDPDAPQADTAAYSSAESLARKDFTELSEEELSRVERQVAALARRLATRLSRRLRPARRGERLDLRRTLRGSLATQGHPLRLHWRSRKVAYHRIVVLLDVSRSMELYSRFLMQLMYALQVRLRGVESFVFSTRLTRVTQMVRRSGYHWAMRQLGQLAAGWAGGTRIGESLDQFVRRHGPAFLGPRTVVIILSDGWDMGEPELVTGAMRDLYRRSGLVIWLNPLLGSPGYRPETRGMRAALPYIHVFAPAHNLESLRRLEPLLRRRGIRRWR